MVPVEGIDAAVVDTPAAVLYSSAHTDVGRRQFKTVTGEAT